MRKSFNHAINLAIVVPLLAFLFYKSVNTTYPHQQIESHINTIDALQVELHRDILRYRNNQLREYDTLNKTVDMIENITRSLSIPENAGKNAILIESIGKLKRTIEGQTELVEDFKTHNAVLQNSLSYFSRLHEEIYGESADAGSNGVSAVLLGKLSTLILEYTRNPDHATALKIFPVLDRLNVDPDSELKTLINHSLIIIERLPEIDALIRQFGTLDVENHINTIKQELDITRAQLDKHKRIYNALLLFCSLYLVSYVAYVLYRLRQSKVSVENSNALLSREVHERTKTERTLFHLVKETADINRDDIIHEILRALRISLGMRYAYISLKDGMRPGQPLSMHLLDNGHYRNDIKYNAEDSPCAEVLEKGRLVHNRDLQYYFPEWKSGKLTQAESYIGITLKMDNDNVIGVIGIADDKPIENTNLAENVLMLMASRTVSELSRDRALKDSERYNSGLELIDKWTLELVSSASNEGQFYTLVCTAAREIANATMALIPKLDPPGDFYTLVSASGHNAESLIGSRMPINDGCLCGWAMLHRQDVRIDDVSSDIRARRQLTNRFDVHTAYVTPIYLSNEVIGAITVFRDFGRFDDIDVQLINQFAQHVQFAIENMQLVHSIADEKERAEVTLHSIGDAVITTDAIGRIDYMNHIAEEITGWPLSKVMHEQVQTVFRILDIDTREPMHNVIDACLSEGTVIHKSVTILIQNDGAERDIESSMSPIKTRDGRVEGAVVVFHDESNRRGETEIIQHRATHDALTGLINRHQFESELKNRIHHAHTHGSTHSLCYLDLDHFKQVNDTCGHDAGDEVLKQITSMFGQAIRGGDIIGRLGGDEFALILENCSPVKAESIANKLIDRISEAPFEVDGESFHIGLSVGIVTIDSRSGGVNEVLKQADVACYTAKDNGRNRACLFELKDEELLRRKKELHWASRISDGLDKSRFKLYAQSICPLQSHEKKRHVEILVRMFDRGGDPVAPSVFIPAAERYNLIGALDQHIIREVFRYIEENENSDSINYCINLSRNSVYDEKFIPFMRQSVAEHGIDPAMVCFEITESVATTNLARTRHTLNELHAMDFRLALDDFGNSLSSPGFLKNLPVDFLKIDGSYVSSMVDNQIDFAMVAAINEMAHIMHMETIAEYAENNQIIEQLLRLGVDFAQGYGISHPAPLDSMVLQDVAVQRVIPANAV